MIQGYDGTTKVAEKDLGTVDTGSGWQEVVFSDSGWNWVDKIVFEVNNVGVNQNKFPECNAGIDDLEFQVQTGSLSYDSSKFKETLGNLGRIDNSTPIVVTLTEDTFTGQDGDDFAAGATPKVSATNLPAGLTLKAERKSDTTVEISKVERRIQSAPRANDTRQGVTRGDASPLCQCHLPQR